MARITDKIQLPTNTTDISTLVRYLKEIKKNEPLNNNTAQPFYQSVKEKGKKSKSYTATGSGTGSGSTKKAKDTHTTGTLSTYGLIDFIDSKKTPNFVVSALGNELIEMYDDDGNPLCDSTSGERLYCDEEYTVMLLGIFSAWHETGNGRDIHPGRIILRLMCEEKLGFYLTEHDVAYFTSNPDFKTDDQYEEIKDYIIRFREKYDGVYGLTKTPCKADIFMPTFVRNWHIFEKEAVYDISPDASNLGHFIFTAKNVATDDSDADDETDEIEDPSDDKDESRGESDGEESSLDESGATETSNFPEGLGASIDLTSLCKNLTHYVLTKESSIYCGMVFGYSNKVEQIVYFGAPGTGKSFGIDEKLEKAKIDTRFQSRVIFYQDYTYGDFVGCLRPKKDKNGVDYQFIAGPLTKAVMKAFENPKDQVYMIIEEINRGSAAAVFGDLFQLLDRNENGKSKYVIRNEDMCSIFTRSPLLKPFFTDGNVWFPSNFNLLCTMNTADQNVFVLDTAFKRRFNMQYVPIDYEVFNKNKKLAPYLAETDVFTGAEDLVTMFAGTELSAIVGKMATEGSLKRNWPTFATLVNATIDAVNKNEGGQISEDKKLGPFFVLIDELGSREKFADKVLYYLKQDVFKYVDTYFVLSYQSIYRDYKNKAIDIFRLLLPGEN